MNSKKTLLILAGGLGSRYKGLKQVDGILDNGSPILEYSIYDALNAGFGKIVIIVNRLIPHSYIERLNTISEIKKFELHWVYQKMESFLPQNSDCSQRQKPWGTGHAVLCAKNTVQEPFVMINADDFYGKEAYQLAAKEIDLHISESQFGMAAYPVKSTLSGNGNVARGICTMDAEGFLIKIEEQTSIREEGNLILYTENGTDIEIASNALVSMNFFIFHPSVFDALELYFNGFIQSGPESLQEFYIPSAVQRMIDEKKAKVLVKPSPSQWMGVTYAEDKKNIKNFLKSEMEKNRYPEDLWN